MKRLTRVLALCTLLTVLAVPLGWGQTIETVIDTVDVAGRSSWEDGHLNLMDLDRTVLGGRALAMGGAGLALMGGAEYHILNPAAILGAEIPELVSEARIYSGGAGVNSVPSSLGEGSARLDATNYRVRPRESLNYSTISFALPVIMLGNRGALAGSYRRVARTGSPDETRVELQGNITNQAEATFGLGDIPEQGLDAITFTAAREITDFLDLGVNLNWHSGTLERSKDIGVANFGFEILSENYSFLQKATAFNIDVGGHMNLGPLDLAGTVYLGHDIDFTEGESAALVVPDPQILTEKLYIRNDPIDHTLSVPTSFGLGAAYELGKLTLAGDLWIRPWSSAEITRDRLDPTFSFADTNDFMSFQYDLIRNPNETEVFNAGLEDGNSLRLGLEYMMIETDRLDLAFRGGFRKEKLTIGNLSVPEEYSDFVALLYAQFCGENPDYTDPNLPDCSELELPDPAVVQAILEEVLEFNHLVFRGEGVDASAITFGVGVRVRSFSADLGFERVSYDFRRFFLQDFDPLVNQTTALADENRSLMNISLTMKMRF